MIKYLLVVCLFVLLLLFFSATVPCFIYPTIFLCSLFVHLLVNAPSDALSKILSKNILHSEGGNSCSKITLDLFALC